MFKLTSIFLAASQLNPDDLGDLKVILQVVAVGRCGRHMNAYFIDHLLGCLCGHLFNLLLDYTAVTTGSSVLKVT